LAMVSPAFMPLDRRRGKIFRGTKFALVINMILNLKTGDSLLVIGYLFLSAKLNIQ
jgi:hypothetical protein